MYRKLYSNATAKEILDEIVIVSGHVRPLTGVGK